VWYTEGGGRTARSSERLQLTDTEFTNWCALYGEETASAVREYREAGHVFISTGQERLALR
jgi:hypothetical protein